MSKFGKSNYQKLNSGIYETETNNNYNNNYNNSYNNTYNNNYDLANYSISQQNRENYNTDISSVAPLCPKKNWQKLEYYGVT